LLNKLAVERENAAIAIFITLEEPTKDMNREPVSACFFYSEAWEKTILKYKY
jgi:hypothetical protein